MHLDDVFALARAVHQVVVHRHVDLTDYLQGRGEKQIGRARHDAFGTVFHRYDGKISGAACGLMKHLVETSAGQSLDARPELTDHSLFGEGAPRPQKSHARHRLDGTAGRNDFAHDAADRIFAHQRALGLGSRHGTLKNLALALGLVHGPGSLEFSD